MFAPPSGVWGTAGATKPKASPAPRKTKPTAGAPVIATDPFTQGIMQQSREDIADISAYNRAAADLLKGVGSSIRAGYGDAAGQIGSLGSAFSGALGTQLRDQGNALSETIRRQTGNYLTPGQYAGIAGSASPQETQDIAYALGAYLPAKNLAETGAAFGAAADFLPGARLQEGAYAIDARQKAAREDIGKARIASAAQASKDAQWKAEQALKVRKLDADIAEAKAKGNIDRLKLLQSQKKAVFDEWYRREGLRIREQNDILDAQAAAARGQEVDASASKGVGYLVDQTGKPILNAQGKRIKVAKTSTAASPGNSAYQKSVKAAEELRGDPIENPSPLYPEAYLADPRAKGADVKKYPDGSRLTNNPKKARYDSQYTFAEAVNILMETYGVTRAQARKALILRGWRPETKPKKDPRDRRGYPRQGD